MIDSTKAKSNILSVQKMPFEYQKMVHSGYMKRTELKLGSCNLYQWVYALLYFKSISFCQEFIYRPFLFIQPYDILIFCITFQVHRFFYKFIRPNILQQLDKVHHLGKSAPGNCMHFKVRIIILPCDSFLHHFYVVSDEVSSPTG